MRVKCERVEATEERVDSGNMRPPCSSGVSASKSEIEARVEKIGVSRRDVGGVRSVMEKRIPLLSDVSLTRW